MRSISYLPTLCLIFTLLVSACCQVTVLHPKKPGRPVDDVAFVNCWYADGENPTVLFIGADELEPESHN